MTILVMMTTVMIRPAPSTTADVMDSIATRGQAVLRGHIDTFCHWYPAVTMMAITMTMMMIRPHPMHDS